MHHNDRLRSHRSPPRHDDRGRDHDRGHRSDRIRTCHSSCVALRSSKHARRTNRCGTPEPPESSSEWLCLPVSWRRSGDSAGLVQAARAAKHGPSVADLGSRPGWARHPDSTPRQARPSLITSVGLHPSASRKRELAYHAADCGNRNCRSKLHKSLMPVGGLWAAAK